jgi:integrase
MVQKYPGLITKGRSFFFRVAIPRKHWDIARCKEICYSLDTSNYSTAIIRWKTEIAHLQTFLNVFEEIVMKINSKNKVVLDENDVDKILLARLSKIQYFLEENTEEIISGEKDFNNIKLPDEQRKALMVEMIVDYLKSLVDNSQANITLRTTYSKLKEKEIELGLEEKTSDGYEWFKSFTSHVLALDRYVQNSIKAIQNERPYTPSNPKVKTLLRSYDELKTQERLTKSMAKTHWKKFFKRYAQNKKNLKGIPDERVRTMYLAVMLGFLLIEKDYIEEITKQDCRKLSEKIYQVPKKWIDKIEKGMKMSDILTSAPTKVLSKATIKSLLCIFKDFLKFAVKEDIIESSFSEFIDTPIRLFQHSRSPFTSDELRKIFNPKTYANPRRRNEIPRFWVPLIALYQGCRLNEICQLDTADIVLSKKIPCINIKSNEEDKSVKNNSSERLIPIHPKLIELGFLTYTDYRRKNKYKKLFDLKQIERGTYGRIVQGWFARYLDKIGITAKDKVFHSFRHTFETNAVENRVPMEYQNEYVVGQTMVLDNEYYNKKQRYMSDLK